MTNTDQPAHTPNPQRLADRAYPNLYQIGPETYVIPWIPQEGATMPGTIPALTAARRLAAVAAQDDER